MITSHQISVLNGLKLFAVVIFLNSAYILNGQKVIYTSEGSVTEIQAAKEVRRYIFLRTGTAPDLAIADSYSNLPDGDVIVVSEDSRDIITELKQEYGNVDAPESDNRKGYLIKSVDKGDGRDILVITGADSITTLNAAYRFAELIGCHFNLAGDVIPDQKLSYPIPLSGYDEKSQPWFEMRGCLPFHNFLAGPDFWSTADYKSFISQQAKMGFNFFGLHVYGEYGEYGDAWGEMEGPEPQLWMGHKADVNPDGTIKEEAAYASYWGSTFRPAFNSWSNAPLKTTDFTNGSGKLFAYDEAASEAIGLKVPDTPAEKAANFNNVGELLKESFTHARQLGVKTVLGSTAPMGFMPKPNSEIEKDRIHFTPILSQERARDVHGITLPTSRGYTNEVFAKAMYEGVFTRIARTHPLDYYWLWTYEAMTYSGDGLNPETVHAVADDYRYCNDVMEAMNTPFKLAGFGWKVGSAGYRTPLEYIDDVSPGVPFGTLWDQAEGINQVIAAGNPGWSTVWYEEDWGLVQPQLRAADAWLEVRAGLNAGGVEALLAKHWRINSIAPMSLAHAQLSWDNRAPVADPLLTISEGVDKYAFYDKWDININNQNPSFVNWITKFYQDWAKANFGPERSNELGSLLAVADRYGESHQIRNGVKGGIPKIAQWLPSSITEFWLDEGDIVDYTDPTFADALHVYTEFCSYKDDIVGTGNRDRYMYWYHFFQAQIELSKLVVHEYYYRNEDPRTDARKDSILDTWAKVMSHEIQRVRNESELGIIAQLQQSTWCRLFKDEYGITDLDTNYEGEEAVRAMPEITQIYENETFSQKVIFIGNGSITDPTMYYREIGSTDTFSTAMLLPIGNSTTVMKAELDDPGYDFEYYIQGSIGGETVTYPVTGGNGVENINKTVITTEKLTYTPKELTPYVAPPAYTLTANVDPVQGTIELNPPGGVYSEGSTVSIKAIANQGYIFDGWSGDITGNDKTASITMDDNKSVTAIFIADPTSVTNANSENSILVYPNPVKDQLRVESADKLEEIRIYSTMGELLFHDKNPSGSIGMNNYTGGIYIMEVKTASAVAFRKIIKR